MFNILEKWLNIYQIGSTTCKEWMSTDLLKYLIKIKEKKQTI
jgi:hypothetical protein